ncbi:fibroblast growth factor receptor substrate 2b [Tachysurus fulvidraco]|uniref:fibroblast growth factor receptor substrate 2b n=1 Tax=Tachysurus fulvidraco TaxID=1234273 RepID=UPI000F5175C1|nr:fibroblast growth factor receptor substrate 2b [Tachysurus fulvidraco]
MGSCWSCPDKESIPDNHQSKFKVVNVDDDGNELGAGIMELTEDELVLRTQKCDAVRWPYLCLRRYGYDSNLFSFESGRRCQTGQGIFAFKCARAEEIFNMLQDIMHNNSISVVEEPVFEPALTHTHTEPDAPQTPRTPTGGALPVLPNGSLRYPSLGDASSHPSSRHPSVGSTRLPSVGEESTHPLLMPDDSIRGHTYVNTTGLLEDQHAGAGHGDPPAPHSPAPEGEEPVQAPDPGPRVQLEREGVRFVLGPTPVQRQLMARERQQDGGTSSCSTLNSANGGVASTEAAPEQSNGPVFGPSRRRPRPPPLSPDANVNNSAQRRTALLDYENLPSLPPLREDPKAGDEEEDHDVAARTKTQPPNGYHSADSAHLYINTENVASAMWPDSVPLSAGWVDSGPLSAGRVESGRFSVFNFDLRRPCETHTLNYIEVEMDPGSDCSTPRTPHTPATPRPPTPTTAPSTATPTRRTELYAVIDVERTAAMSNLQRAQPRYDGTSRKTRHNSVDLPM